MIKYLLFPVRFLYTLYAVTLFVLIMLLIFPVAIYASLLHPVKGGNLVYRLCRIWADASFVCWGIRHTNYYVAPHDPSRQFVFVFNHISFIDIPVIMKSIRRQPLRILGRGDLVKIPVFGFLYRIAVVCVDRSNPANRSRSILELKKIIAQGISILIAPEGTFNTTGQPLAHFYDGAFRIAIETGTPIKALIFPDNYNRLSFRSVFSLTPGKTRAYFLPEIDVSNYTIEQVHELKALVYRQMEEHIIALNAGWLQDAGRDK